MGQAGLSRQRATRTWSRGIRGYRGVCDGFAANGTDGIDDCFGPLAIDIVDRHPCTARSQQLGDGRPDA